MSAKTNAEITYRDAGVDTAAGARAVDLIKEAVHRTYTPDVIGDIGGFGGLFSAARLKEMDDPILVSGTDGVGTKLAVAQLLDMHDTVGQDLVAMCANDILASGAEPLFFLDYIAVGKLNPERVARIVAGVADGCELAGCALIGGEMAEHPGTMPEDDYDLSGFCVGMVDRKDIIGPHLVQEGDAIVGLASSGVHSNGFSLVRRACVDGRDIAELTTPCDSLGGKTMGEALMAPTRIYVKPALAVLRELSSDVIHAFAHITGGGITENLDRAMPKHLDAAVDRGSWPEPAVISQVIEQAGLSVDEAYKTFNMGIGLAVMCAPDAVQDVIAAFEAQGEAAYLMGEVVAGTGKVVYR